MADRALTDLELERWLAGALPDERTRRASAADRARLEELRAEHAALLAGSDVAAEVAAIERRVARAAPGRRRLAGWWWAAGGALAAAAALVIVIQRHLVEPNDEEIMSPAIRTSPHHWDLNPKGDAIGLMIHVADPAGSHRVATGDTVRPGDRLRFELSVAKPGYVAVIGIDGAGAVAVYYPVGGRAPAPFAPRDGGVLPGAIELDGTPGDEQFVAIYAEQPFLLDAALLAAVQATRPVAGVTTASVRLRKKTSRF